MADVFISYHEASAGEIVKQIAAELESVGVSCWYAERDLTAPGSFAATITQEIRACKVFLLVLDEGGNQSEHVKSEVYLAFQRISKHENMKPFYFKIDDCILSDDMAYYLSRFQITNGNPSDQEHMRRLTKQIADIVQPEPPTWEMVWRQQQRIRELETQVAELQARLYARIQSNNHKRELIGAVREDILRQAQAQAHLLEQINLLSFIDGDLKDLVEYHSFSYVSQSDALKKLQKQVLALADEQAYSIEQLRQQILGRANEQASLLEQLQQKL